MFDGASAVGVEEKGGSVKLWEGTYTEVDIVWNHVEDRLFSCIHINYSIEY